MTILIAGGGTGGHVYPMVAVGEALAAEEPTVRVVYVGTGRGIEARVVPAAGGQLELLDVLPLRGGGLGGLLRGAWRAAAVLPAARSLVRRIDPQVVFSVGGYAAGPVALAARSCGVPLTLLEPNAVLGLTNRVLSRLVARAYVCFPEVRASLPAGRARWTGVPLRRHFATADYRPAEPAKLLVMGGSQGAQALNERLPEAVGACLRAGLALEVVHQTGRGKQAGVLAAYRSYGAAERVRVVPFIDDVPRALGAADVVVERAGAGSLAELCAVGRAAVLVPYPHAADAHQLHNARSLERAGAAVCVEQSEATAERLGREIAELVLAPQRRVQMAACAAARGRPAAARAIARDLLALGRGERLGSEDQRGASPDREGADPGAHCSRAAAVAAAARGAAS